MHRRVERRTANGLWREIGEAHRRYTRRIKKLVERVLRPRRPERKPRRKTEK